MVRAVKSAPPAKAAVANRNIARCSQLRDSSKVATKTVFSVAVTASAPIQVDVIEVKLLLHPMRVIEREK